MKDSYIYRTEEQFHNDIRKAINKSVPNMFEEIYSDCVKKEQEEKHSNRGVLFDIGLRKKRYLYKLVCSLAVMAVIVGSATIYHNHNVRTQVVSQVMLDVNPSVNISVNKDDVVVSAQGVNEDGKEVLSDIKVINLDIDKALDIIMESMIDKGFISQKTEAILLTVKNANEKYGIMLEEKLYTGVDDFLQESNINIELMAQVYEEDKETSRFAKKNNISEGKARLIKKIEDAKLTDAQGKILASDKLVNLNVSELHMLLESKNILIDDIICKGENVSKQYVKEDKVHKLVCNHANVGDDKVKDIDIQIECSEDKLVYNVEFMHNEMTYKYVVDAKTGDILNNSLKNSGSNKSSGSKNHISTVVVADNISQMDIEKEEFKNVSIEKTNKSDVNINNTVVSANNYQEKKYSNENKNNKYSVKVNNVTKDSKEEKKQNTSKDDEFKVKVGMAEIINIKEVFDTAEKENNKLELESNKNNISQKDSINNDTKKENIINSNSNALNNKNEANNTIKNNVIKKEAFRDINQTVNN